VVKVLLKLVQAVQNEDDLGDYKGCDSSQIIPSLKLMLHSNKKSVCKARSEKDMMDLALLSAAFCHRAARLLVEVAGQLQSFIMGGMNAQEAWNQALVQMARISRAYSQFLLLQSFVSGIEEEERALSIGQAESNVLRDLARLFALYWMERELGDFMEDGYVSAEQASWVRSSVLVLLDAIRPNAVALVDARDFSDFRLKSALGRYDGDVYPAIMDAARRDPLNQSEPGPGYEEHLKRLIVGGVGVYTGTASRL
jgi:acyl-CoA oxidase